MAIYNSGQAVRLWATFTVSDVATDPTTVVCKCLNPSGEQMDYVYGTDAELVKAGTGAYHIDIVPAAPGTWAYRWEGTGACKAVAEMMFDVRPTRFV